MGECIYNGVTLPKLPKAEYAYVTIIRMLGTDTYRAIFSDLPMVIREVDDPQVMTWANEAFFSAYIYTQGGTDDWVVDTDVDRIGSDTFWYYETYNAEWVWSNTDILDENDVVIYEATDPVLIVVPSKSHLRSWLAGYLTALCGPVLSMPEKQPTAYSYNGVILPALPEWDKTVYPYAYIYSYGPLQAGATAEYNLSVTVNQGVYHAGTHVFNQAEIAGVGNQLESYGLKLEEHSDWPDFEKVTKGYISMSAQLEAKLIWSNVDVYHEDGTLYLAASDPIPAYE